MTAPAPPPFLLYGYRLLGLRLPAEHGPWVAHDVTTKGYLNWMSIRRLVWGFTAVGLYALGQRALYAWPATRPTLLRLCIAVIVWALLTSGPRMAKRTLRWQRVDKRGNPVPPRGHGLMTQAEAGLAAAALLIVVTAAAAAIGYGLRPAGVAVARCDSPTEATMAELTAAIKQKGATFQAISSIEYRSGQVIGALLRAPNAKDPSRELSKLEFWVYQDGKYYTIARDAKDPSWSRFPTLPAADRVANEAFNRVAGCLAKQLPQNGAS